MKILLATDGYEPAHRAGQLLRRLFDPKKVSVTVTTVADVPAPEIFYNEHAIRLLDLPVSGAEEVAKEEAERMEAAGFAADYGILQGDPAERLIESLSDSPFELLVVGAGRRSWLGNVLLGSVSTHILHSAPSSVLIVHRSDNVRSEETSDLSTIVLGTDGSRAARLAEELLIRTVDNHRVRISVISVIPRLSLPLFDYPSGTYDLAVLEQARTQEGEMIGRSERFAKEAAARLSAAGFLCDSALLDGDPAATLLKEIELENADLVAVGSRGRGPVRRAVLGSVSDHLARLAPAALVARKQEP